MCNEYAYSWLRTSFGGMFLWRKPRPQDNCSYFVELSNRSIPFNPLCNSSYLILSSVLFISKYVIKDNFTLGTSGRTNQFISSKHTHSLKCMETRQNYHENISVESHSTLYVGPMMISWRYKTCRL